MITLCTSELLQKKGMLEVNVLKREKCLVASTVEEFEEATRNKVGCVCKDIDFSSTDKSYWERDDLRGILFMGKVIATCVF